MSAGTRREMERIPICIGLIYRFASKRSNPPLTNVAIFPTTDHTPMDKSSLIDLMSKYLKERMSWGVSVLQKWMFVMMT